ncbi:CHAT domain-containing protein [Frankia sp. AgB32]|uniref:CHAT domain-containing protein n=1 Tax=Frankia sp. AgB32 TaxID=631119 RepID=UPI002010C46D|nr:CHAT domain-containing protein [Frankia sp. AgB32]MCK9893603.1 CHAT domain-containing protein [Frankia sp. AgB32]
MLVEYFVTDDETYIVAVAPEWEAPETLAVAVGADELAELARAVAAGEVAAALEHRGLARLLAPVARWARPEDVVYLVPHQAMHRLPLQAVQVEGTALIERNPVMTVPSASVLRYCRAKRKARRESVMVVTGPAENRPLALGQMQSLLVADVFRSSQVVSGRGASRAYLMDVLSEPDGGVDVLHFTAHGVFDPDDPMRSGLELVDGRLTAADVLSLSLDVDLVTLGACDSGIGADLPGDNMLGLTWALLYAGAPSALVSLWQVDELASSLLLTRFYTELRSGVSKAQALRAAQLWLRTQTFRDVLALVAASRDQFAGEPFLEATVLEQEAWLHAASGNPGAALERYRAVAASPAVSSARRERAESRVRQIRVTAQLGGLRAAPGCPFADPRFWAPFFLSGDWL